METEKENVEELLVYIVDDDPMFSAALANYLKQELPKIRFASFQNGEACLHEMHRNPDLILLDYRLDSEFQYAWDGLQILKRINSLNPEAKVVILSSNENIEIAMDCVNNGALEYIVKNDKSFFKVKEILLSMSEEFVESKDVKLGVGGHIPQLIGVVLLILLIIVLLLKL
jgi:two-component system OmpR family response regulator